MGRICVRKSCDDNMVFWHSVDPSSGVLSSYLFFILFLYLARTCYVTYGMNTKKYKQNKWMGMV